MINPEHLMNLIIKPTLEYIDMYSESAATLVLGTAIQESSCGTYLKQLVGGPAVGIYQMEPITHRSVWVDVIYFNPKLLDVIMDLVTCNARDYFDETKKNNKEFIDIAFKEMIGNLYYATAMCRVQYSRFKEPLPDDIVGLAQYWKKYYNTEDGDGTAEEFVKNYHYVMSKGEV